MALVVAIAANAAPARSQGRAVPVGVDPIVVEPFNATVPVIGRLLAPESGTVASRIAERVIAIEVHVGDRVGKGDLLATLATDRLRGEKTLRMADLRMAEAAVAREKANFKRMEQRYKSTAALRGSTAFRQDRHDDIERDLEVTRSATRQAAAEVVRARASLDLAEIALQDALVTAPYPGVVIGRHSVAGNYVRIGDPIVTLLNDQAMEIEVDVPALRAARLTVGTEVQVSLQDGVTLQASIRAVVPEENPRTRTRGVRLTPLMPMAAAHFAGNQAVTVQIPVGAARQATTVHKDAIVINGGRQMVYVVEDGKVAPRPVETGESSGNRVEVLSGLMEGDIAVVRGNERLRPGQAVKPLEPG